jgi:dihydrofolate reductase
VIGRNGKVPWDIPEDLRRFMRLTSGHTVLMGRKSFESLGKPLPNRRNVVLSSHPVLGVETYSTIDAALQALKNNEKVFVIGGGEIFTAILNKLDVLQLTLVERIVEGDTYFPPYEEMVKSKFVLVFEERHEGFRYLDYERKKPETAV